MFNGNYSFNLIAKTCASLCSTSVNQIVRSVETENINIDCHLGLVSKALKLLLEFWPVAILYPTKFYPVLTRSIYFPWHKTNRKSTYEKDAFIISLVNKGWTNTNTISCKHTNTMHNVYFVQYNFPRNQTSSDLS